MKTYKQLLSELREPPEVEVPIHSIRDRYFHGEVLLLGEKVDCEGGIYTIIQRGANHLVLEHDDGTTIRRFPTDFELISEDQYGADFTYSETKNKDGSRRKNHINRIEFSNSGIITKSNRVVDTTARVGKPLILKPTPIRDPYKKLLQDDDERRSMKSFVRKLDKTVNPESKIKKPPKVDPRTTSGVPDQANGV